MIGEKLGTFNPVTRRTTLGVMASPWPLAVLVLVFAVVATLYSLNTPLLEGSDEPAHFEYVLSLARGMGLPLLQATAYTAPNYEAHQPPLYYSLAALTLFGIDTSDYESLVRENPNRAFDPLALTNRNLYVHTRRENWPYSGAVLAMRLARLVSMLAGVGTLVATYGLGRTLFPARPEVGFAAAAFVAFLPQFAFVSGVVSNDSLAAMMAALGAWLLADVCLRIWNTSPLRMRQTSPTFAPSQSRRWVIRLVVLGLVLALAAMSKESDLALVPGALLLLAAVVWKSRGLPAALGASLLVGGSLGLATGWWFLLRHEWLGFWVGSSDATRSLIQLSPEGFLLQWNELEISFWGLFGWNIIPLPQPIYDVLHNLSLAAAAALLIALARRRQWTSVEFVAIGTLCAWIAIVFIAYVNWMRVTAQAHGRLLFPALPAFALLVCLGLTQVMPGRWRSAMAIGIAALMVCISAWSALNVLPAGYPYPVELASAESIPNRLDANLDGRLALLGYTLLTRQNTPRSIVDVDLYWQVAHSMNIDYTVTIQVFDENGIRIGHLDTYPSGGMSLTRDWRVGAILKDHYPVEIGESAGQPVRATVVLGLYDQHTGKALQVVQNDGRRIARVTLGQITLTH